MKNNAKRKETLHFVSLMKPAKAAQNLLFRRKQKLKKKIK
jgi:hypothetical protein